MNNQKLKILIIEDDIPLAEMYRARLEMENYKVSCAKDGEEGLRKAEKERPDLIILDIMLPGIYGETVLEKLKEGTKTKDIPIIILTALSFNKIKDLTPKVEDFMIKSEVSLEEAVLRVKKILKRNEI